MEMHKARIGEGRLFRLGLIGFGAFGRMVARHLAPHLPVAVCDPDPAAQAQARAAGESSHSGRR